MHISIFIIKNLVKLFFPDKVGIGNNSLTINEIKIKLFLAQIHIEKTLNREKRNAGIIMTCDYNRSFPGQIIMIERDSELVMLPMSARNDEKTVPNMIIATSDSRILEQEAPPVQAKGVLSSVVNRMDSFQRDKTGINLRRTLLIRSSSTCFTNTASFHLPQMSLVCGAFIDELVVL